ncbi:uncharacterized protein LOC108112078 [Drosophila eugracilis]|uniref:uncharacterized protein LOC108112078 n=1 Tax=Drosophila eugracilis TaxID=29029 RepID=UPI0007E6F369|nr:uncharacterized protein LOC108112078 [Drosophila eugracilis]
MTWLVILLICVGQLEASISDISAQNESHIEDGLLVLLLKLRQEEFYDTLIVYGEDCVFHSVIRHLDVPTVLVSSGSTSYDWNFSSLTMILGCGPNADQEVTNRTLIKLQRNRRLIYLQGDIPPENVCNNYAQKEQFNIAMLKDDFDKSQIIYTCRYFQDPNFEEISLSEKKPIYIEQFRNMHGKPIRTMADLFTPRSMLYTDTKTNETKMTGYVANLISYFVLKVNATLNLEVLERNSSLRNILKKVKDDQIDIATTLETSLHETPLDTASYPFLLTTYCLMLKVPSKLPYNVIYAMIVDRLVLVIIFVMFCLISALLIYSENMTWRDLRLSNILLNDVSLRGLLGQSHPFPSNASKPLRMVFCILCFASIMMTTMYDAYLQSFFTDPPPGPHIRSFRDFGKFNQKIAITRIEVNVLTSSNNSQFREIPKDYLKVFDNWRDCIALRDAFNLSYNFLVTGDRWSAYAEQQTLFKEPLFYFAKDLCFSRLLFLSIPLRKHLPYRHLFEDHMMRQHEFGLVNYWKSHSFFDMVRFGKAPLKDLSQPKAYNRSLFLEDISFIMKLYLAAVGVSILCFLSEIGGAKWRQWRKLRNYT